MTSLTIITHWIGCLYPFQANAKNHENKILLRKLDASSGLVFALSSRTDGLFLKSAKQFSKNMKMTPAYFKELKIVTHMFAV